jgi:hypothetical protein
VMVMADDHAAEQNEQQEPAEARKHALSGPPCPRTGRTSGQH